MNQILIRKAEITDMPVLLAFEQGIIAAELPMDPTLKRGPNHYYDIEELITAPHIEFVVAESAGDLLGCGYARIEASKHYLQHTQHAYLGFMYTDPAHRGKGVNRLIMDALEQWSLAQGIRELRLDVYDQNPAAIRAYEKAGFSRNMINMRKGLEKNSSD
jgi:GNAT superfamily N-acetyltransferase